MRKFNRVKLDVRAQGPDDEDRFDMTVRTPRELIAHVTAGPPGSHFLLTLAPPRFTSDTAPQLMVLVVDNSRMLVDAADRLFFDFVEFASKNRCVIALVTLDYSRRYDLFSDEWLALTITDESFPYPWDLLDSLIIVHTDNPEDVDKITARIG